MTLENVDYHIDCKVNAIKIDWLGAQNKTNIYIVKFREQGKNVMFQTIQTNEHELLLSNLKSGTQYEIRVYFQENDGDERLHFSTTASTAAPILSPCIGVCDKISEKPTIYRFRQSNIRHLRRDVKICDIGLEKEGLKHVDVAKTILIVGGRAAGKSTLIDAMINYVVGVLYVDDYRFKLVDDSDIRETKSITCYEVPPLNGPNVEYGLTIIDTPGFDDEKESIHNLNIMQQITALLESGVVKFIDAVCLVLPSSCRLTKGQRNIFDSIMSLFGKDINCFIPMFTFDDGGQINALSALKKAEVPYMDHMYFRFNNSGLFNISESEEAWNRRFLSFKGLFETLPVFAKQSVELTSKVLYLKGHLHEQIDILRENKDIMETKTKCLAENKAAEKHQEWLLKQTENYRYEENECNVLREVTRNQMCINCPACMETCAENSSFCTSFFWWFIRFCSWCWSVGCIRLFIRCIFCLCVLCDVPSSNLIVCKCKCLLGDHRIENIRLVKTFRKVEKEHADKKATYESAAAKLKDVQMRKLDIENELHSLVTQCDLLVQDLQASFEQLRKISLFPGNDNEVKKFEEYFKQRRV